MKAIVTTDITADGDIIQTRRLQHDDGYVEYERKYLYKMSEKGVAEALIKLGWTPPTKVITPLRSFVNDIEELLDALEAIFKARCGTPELNFYDNYCVPYYESAQEILIRYGRIKKEE